MRPLNLSSIKRGYDGRQHEPRPGTRLRAVYDRLMDGEEVSSADLSPCKTQLEDFYGLEFRQPRRGVNVLYLR